MSIHSEKVELLRKVDLFSDLREYELDVIATNSDFINVKKGEPVFEQGAAADSLYVVDKGRIGIISIENSSSAVIAQITAEESFGEIDFFGRTVRSASAFAETDAVLLRCPAAGQHADDIFIRQPVISARMLYTMLCTVSKRIWNVNSHLQNKTSWLFDLHKQLLCDKQTGLYNQTFLKEDFITLLPHLGKSAALLMIKPDNFKQINDTCGHTAGDQVLNLMAIFLHAELGEADIGVRFKGDEYAAILADTDRANAAVRAEEIRRTFEEMDISGITGTDIRISSSIGIALYPEETDDGGMLIKHAHKKMFTARESGGGRIEI